MNKNYWSKAHVYEEAGAYKMALLNLLMAKKTMNSLSEFIDFDIRRLNKFEKIDSNEVDEDFKSYENNIKKQIAKIKSKDLFDEKWFLKKYKKINFRGLDALEFYVRYGNFFKLDPNPEFSTSLYLKTYPGNWELNASALYRHIIREGVFAFSPNSIYAADIILNDSSLSHDKHSIINFLDLILTNEFKYTSEVIKANEAIKDNDEKVWLDYFNSYLSNVSTDVVELNSGEGSIFDRLESKGKDPILGGDLVTVIMPAWNAEKTIKKSIDSILNQTWKNLELIVVDDASTDNTWSILCNIEKYDSRLKILKNENNVGPYVSKNIALKHANGIWVTGHDADDYALPSRIEEHVREAVKNNYDASITYMIRMRPDGFFDHLGKIANFSFDGVARKASITCLFRRKILVEKLGYWDSVRYGADSELIARTQLLLGDKFGVIQKISMICLSLEGSLTNNPITGIRTESGMSPVRVAYKNSWSEWHKKIKNNNGFYLDYPPSNRVHLVPAEMDV